jgi:hypothetical protein
MKLALAALAVITLVPFRPSLAEAGSIASSSAPTQQQCASFVPRVDPWRLQRPVLMGNAKVSYYYKGVILAGDSDKVSEFLECYDLTVKFRVDYASWRPMWGACTEITNPSGSNSQIVCVAIDSNGTEADPNIFSSEYAQSVAEKVFY